MITYSNCSSPNSRFPRVAAVAVCLVARLPLTPALTNGQDRGQAAAAAPKPMQSLAPPLSVLVDPRIELLSLVFRVAGNPEYNQGRIASYNADVDRQFSKFRDHPAVALARELRQKSAVSYDAGMNLGILLTGIHQPSLTVPLGRTKLKVSWVCIGTGMRGGNRELNQTRMGKQKFEGLLRGAYEWGVRLFDLADLYGTHPYLVPALKGIPRDDYAIITKIWWRPAPRMARLSPRLPGATTYSPLSFTRRKARQLVCSSCTISCRSSRLGTSRNLTVSAPARRS
jgi:uncharacterized protein DUF4932